MARIHFLNVKEGDCSVIEHNSSRVTVIDVCNAKPTDRVLEELEARLARLERGTSGNFQQKMHPVNPITYLHDHGISSIFRYVQTHPDMDHMDGIKALFEAFQPLNLWDTDNKKEMPRASWQSSPYSEDDWKFYKNLRDSKPEHDPKRLALLSGAHGPFYNVGEDGIGGGDGLHILAPTKELVAQDNDADDEYHRSSYVLLYRTASHRVVFGGDSHDESWEYILNNFEEDVSGIDLLIAPHHGRRSGRSYEFLDILAPALTFFGNARSEHLAYDAWRRRGLPFITNNQANCMVVDASAEPMDLYVTHEAFARTMNARTVYNEKCRGWYVCPISRG